MTISRDEAAKAIHLMERTQARAFDARVYRNAGAQLILWGAIWALAYTLSGLWPHRLGLIWPPMVLTGVLAGFFLMRRARAASGLDPKFGLRWAVQAAAIALFIYATYLVFPITSPAQALTFPVLLLAFIYALIGSARFARLLWIGAALFVLAVGGFVFLKPYIAFWLAAVGGGGLVAGGLWLRGA